MSADVAKEASELMMELSGEVYYGFNLAFILAESSQEERDTIRRIVNRAKEAREKLG